MTPPSSGDDFFTAWIAFLEAIEKLLAEKNANRASAHFHHLDAAAGQALSALKSEFTDPIVQSWITLSNSAGGRFTADLLCLEVAGFAKVVRDTFEGLARPVRRRKNAKQASTPDKPRRLPVGARDKLFRGVSVVLESMTDLMDHLPIYVKGPIKVLGEITDILGG